MGPAQVATSPNRNAAARFDFNKKVVLMDALPEPEPEVRPIKATLTFAQLAVVFIGDQPINAVAKRAGMDGSYLSRILHPDRQTARGRREPRRGIILSLAYALELSDSKRDALLISAGYWPWVE